MFYINYFMKKKLHIQIYHKTININMKQFILTKGKYNNNENIIIFIFIFFKSKSTLNY